MGFGKRTIPLFFVILALVITIAWVRKESARQEGGTASPKAADPSPLSSPQLSPTPSTTPSPAQISGAASGPLEFPSVREVREQVAQDPHHTPPALLQFAKDLSARAEIAKGSTGSAKVFFEKLEECVQSGKEQGEGVPVAAQTLCLTTAEEFAKLYPEELGARLPELQKNASPEAKRIRAALNRF